MAAPNIEEDYKPGMLPYPESENRKDFCKYHWKGLMVLLVPILLCPLLFVNNSFVLPQRMIYLGCCVYIYYIFNLISQGAIAFIYIVLVPVMGIASSKDCAKYYYVELLFVTYGSIFAGIMMDASKLSERLAMWVIKITGSSMLLLQFVLMIGTFLCSILFNSTFISAIWMKIAMAVMKEFKAAGVLETESDEETYERQSIPYPTNPAIGVYLTVCYASTLGAMISIFQEPNYLIHKTFKKHLEDKEPGKGIILLMGPAFIGLIFVWISIVFFFFGYFRVGIFKNNKTREMVREASAGKDTLRNAMNAKKDAMGPWGVYPILVFIMLIVTLPVLLTRHPLIFWGWGDELRAEHGDQGASVALILMAILWFAIPANYAFCRYYCCIQPAKPGKSPSLIGWNKANADTPWAHIFMLGSAFSGSYALKAAKVYELIGDHLVKIGLERKGAAIHGAIIGTSFAALVPGCGVSRFGLQTMIDAGLRLKLGAGAVAIAFSSALHISFLLPVSAPANTIVAGWANIRPYQF
ncbi:CG7309, partial [Drosophila busckii]